MKKKRYYEELTTEIELDNGETVNVLVEFNYDQGHAGQWTLSNGDPGYPAEPPSVEIVSVTYLDGDKKGEEVADELLASGTIDDLEEQCLETMGGDDGYYD